MHSIAEMATAPDDDDERRAFPRKEMSAYAVAFPGMVECTIADLSTCGARIRCADPKALGDFPIIVDWASGQAFDCVVVWREGTHAGVRFFRNGLLTDVVAGTFR